MVEPRTFFDELGINYFGPFDGHDLGKLERVFSRVSHLEGPCLVHVLTQKGRGYAPAENDPVKNMHDMSKAKPGSYTEAFTEAMIKEAEARPEMVAITAAMPDSTGLLPFAERFPERCFDVGIAEQHAVTAAAGMAMGGLRPVVAIYSTFLTRAIDQVNLDVGLHGQPVVFCLDRAGITGDDGPSHHGVLDMVLLTKIPGMTVLAPSSYQEIQQMLHDALEITTGPVAMRWSQDGCSLSTGRPSGPRSQGPQGERGLRRVPAGGGQDAGQCSRSRRAPGGRWRIDHRVGRALRQATGSGHAGPRRRASGGGNHGRRLAGRRRRQLRGRAPAPC